MVAGHRCRPCFTTIQGATRSRHRFLDLELKSWLQGYKNIEIKTIVLEESDCVMILTNCFDAENFHVSWHRRLAYLTEDNWRRIWVIALWISICLGLYAWEFIQYRNRSVFDVMGYCVSIAKGGAESLKFNMALILLPVCRNSITWLRSKTKLGVVVPFDDNINFHKVIAFSILVGVGLRAGSHLTCDFPRLLHSTDNELQPMKPFFGTKLPDDYWWFVRGTEGWTRVVMVVLMLVAYTLAQPWFPRNRLNLPKTLKKLTGLHPLYIHGYFLYLSKNWEKKTVAVYPGNVLARLMSKPQGFKYTSGQYIYINCSDISPFQWHPFSITSAPGDDYLSIHIRILACISRMTRLLIDGPYGAPAQDYKKYEVLLLVGLGIGATPLISILKGRRIVCPPSSGTLPYPHILYNPPPSQKCALSNIKHQREVEDNQGIKDNKRTFVTKRAYFYWITREQGSFEWFRGVTNEVAETDIDGKEMLDRLFTMLQSLNHAKNGVDVGSGTRVKTYFARPNWHNIFKHVAIKHTDQRVRVFYCGAHGLVGELKEVSSGFFPED
ncbi:unnamed protein product [Malus baccata var. baccata]